MAKTKAKTSRKLPPRVAIIIRVPPKLFRQIKAMRKLGDYGTRNEAISDAIQRNYDRLVSP
jgi:Arc/MetJ-type ribon-helix-helix transcriptional regulator